MQHNATQHRTRKDDRYSTVGGRVQSGIMPRNGDNDNAYDDDGESDQSGTLIGDRDGSRCGEYHETKPGAKEGRKGEER